MVNYQWLVVVNIPSVMWVEMQYNRTKECSELSMAHVLAITSLHQHPHILAKKADRVKTTKPYESNGTCKLEVLFTTMAWYVCDVSMFQFQISIVWQLFTYGNNITQHKKSEKQWHGKAML